jgi:hypothetical protein
MVDSLQSNRPQIASQTRICKSIEFAGTHIFGKWEKDLRAKGRRLQKCFWKFRFLRNDRGKARKAISRALDASGARPYASSSPWPEHTIPWTPNW